MLLSTIDHPITILNLNEFNISLQEVQQTLSNNYHNYGWDNYLLQQNKISIIKSFLSENKARSIPNKIWLDLYQSKISDNEIIRYFPFITEKALLEIQEIKPNRQRCVSEYILELDNNNWYIERINSIPFSQKLALVFDESLIDYRLSERIFKELPNELYDDNLKAMIKMVAYQVLSARPNCKKLNLVIHHTLVWCTSEKLGDNSPEGIHQDGMNFIVSALCIERKNINGAKSIIYGSDKKTPLFAMELQPGQGIFQPDAGSDLWHKVTPFTVQDNSNIGYRATIGFDVMVVA